MGNMKRRALCISRIQRLFSAPLHKLYSPLLFQGFHSKTPFQAPIPKLSIALLETGVPPYCLQRTAYIMA